MTRFVMRSSIFPARFLMNYDLCLYKNIVTCFKFRIRNKICYIYTLCLFANYLQLDLWRIYNKNIYRILFAHISIVCSWWIDWTKSRWFVTHSRESTRNRFIIFNMLHRSGCNKIKQMLGYMMICGNRQSSCNLSVQRLPWKTLKTRKVF